MDEINSVNSMLEACVRAIGDFNKKPNQKAVGSKIVGTKLWPEKMADDAGQLLRNCLNESRPEKLSPDQAFLIESWAKECGCHIAIEFRCREMKYSQPTPITPEDETAELMRQFIEAQKSISLIAERIGNLNSGVRR